MTRAVADDRVGRREITALTLAAWASLGAGAIHAAAVGVHGEHRAAALTFTAVAVLQVLWAGAALVVPGRALALVGSVGNGALVLGWVMAKTSGIPFVDGLDHAEAAQVPDTTAAVLAAAAAALALAVAMDDGRVRSRILSGRLGAPLAALAVVALTVPGLAEASGHDHAGAGGHGHEEGHDDGHEVAAGAPVGASDGGHGHEAAPVPPKPYDPEAPIDLSGVEGVTPQQQAAAENLIAITLDRLPRYADPAVAEADGFRSIGDGATGHEHYINWSYIGDEHILNPDFPESLVYEPQPDGSKRLVSAMFMLRTGDTLDDVPELGGELTQWHVHDDLCFTTGSDAPRVAAVTAVGGTCDPPLVKFDPVPMIHVWIVPHPCGPFAALDGVGAGQIAPGETRLCDHAHGA